jgi:hypothetical protein
MKQLFDNTNTIISSLFLVCILQVLPQFSYSQETTLPAGGDAHTANGSFSYSLGQLFYTTVENTSGSIRQGVQQCYEITPVTNVEEPLTMPFECSVYPNPATDILKLTIHGTNGLKGITYTIYNASGQVLFNNPIQSVETDISVTEYTPALYFIDIKVNNNLIRTFKIIKN